ncbi:hypothetical protein BDZ94DRAFT_621876 [Collybia nuda]|uniref:Uncharacterized protein n=1 Tax=Collybia nuda TaxID=64659 RepID=A0A9P6CEU6_9AGAR|nr:hypothetical protein BDZ94DRAFT_621876 [Collybia nuda]
MSENPLDHLMLPAPTADATHTLGVDGPSVRLDDLGPMIVNSDGVSTATLSRIANWANMTNPERERTVRVLTARNKARLTNEERKEKEGEEAGESLSITRQAPPSAESN